MSPPKTNLRVRLITCLGLVVAILQLNASPDDWSPFPARQAPPMVRWTEWRANQDSNREAGLSETNSIWRFSSQSSNWDLDTATLRKVTGHWVLTVNAEGKVDQATLPDASDYAEVLLTSADLKHDQVPDYVLRYDRHGCGLGAIGQTVILILSGKNGHRSHELYQLGFAEDNLVQFKPKGPWHWIVTHLVRTGYGAARDGKAHSVWVYRLFRIEGDELKPEPVGDHGFPKWIWYTHRSNHDETTQLTPEQKRKLEKGLTTPTQLQSPRSGSR